MLVVITAAAVAGWLVLLTALMAVPWKMRAHRDGEPPLPGTESPAVVSLLAGRLDYAGYPATVLDLAARGWLRLDAPPGGPVLCVISPEPPREQLGAHERRVYDQVVSRAGDRSDVPAAALSGGFAGPATIGGSEREMKSATDSFMAAFRDEVIADSRRRGLSHQRLGEAAGCLLWLAATGPAAAGFFALRAAGHHAYWIPVAGFAALWAVTAIAARGEKLTRAGRATLRRWRARCAGPGAARLPPAGATGSGAAQVPGGMPVTSMMPAGWPDRQVAYAAALGADKAAVRLFSAPPGQPEGRTVWSGYTGSWRQITIGDPPPRGWRGAGEGLLGLGGVLLLALAPATLAIALISGGAVRVAAFAVMAGDAAILLRMADKRARIPRSAEFDGQVIEAWVNVVTEDLGTSYFAQVAIDDGQRDRAWVFSVSREQYATLTPGTYVHAWVNPGRNELTRVELIG